MPIPVQECIRKEEEKERLTARSVGYLTRTVNPSTFTVATPEHLRNAFRNWP
jgi:hypothetical protein